jgi:hypothetical protein
MPGSDAQLAELVARITSRPLDRARPLWELYLIHGLRDGHVAMRVRKLLGGRVPQGSERFTAPRTSFNGRISPHRRFTFGQLALDDVKAIKDDYGCTVNDAIMSICAGAVRRWLIEHDELPDQPLVAQVPVSVRSQEQIGTYGNRILLMSAPLFTNVADPVERLHRTHEALGDMKERHQALPATLLQDANHFIPPAVFHRAAQLTFRLSTSSAAHPTWNLVISNVPGIVADRGQMPDLDRFLGWLGDGVRELLPADSGPATDTPAAPAPQRVDGTAATSTTQSVTEPADR